MSDYYNKKSYREDVRRSLKSIVGAKRLKDKKILITGAGGMVGSFITDVLNEAGCATWVAGRNPDKLAARFPKSVPIYYDLEKEIEFNIDFDYMILMAGYGHPGAFYEDPVGILVNSVNGTDRLLTYALEHGTDRVLYVSSGEVYGNIDSMSFRACYPLGKQAGENLCASYYEKYGVNSVVCRLCHTFGPGISWNDNRATAQFIRNALAGENIVLKSKGEQRRSYLYAADSASAILSVLTSGEAGCAYDIASDDCIVTIAELAGLIARAVGMDVVYDIPSEKEISQRSPIAEQILDGNMLAALGWKGAYSIEEGCRNTIDVLNT